MEFNGVAAQAASYEASPADGMFVSFLATVYDHLVKLTPPCKGRITRFHASKAPDVSIKDYLERIQKYFGCSNECFVLSLVYIDRIVKIHDDFSVSILNVHRLLITSVMLAAKFFDDVYYSNAFYARVGGVRAREINILEAHFLSLLDFHLFVSPQEYDQYRRNVLVAVCRQNLQRAPRLPSQLEQESYPPQCNTPTRNVANHDLSGLVRNPVSLQQLSHPLDVARSAAPATEPLVVPSAYSDHQRQAHPMIPSGTMINASWHVQPGSHIPQQQTHTVAGAVAQPLVNIGAVSGYAKHPNLQGSHLQHHRALSMTTAPINGSGNSTTHSANGACQPNAYYCCDTYNSGGPETQVQPSVCPTGPHSMPSLTDDPSVRSLMRAPPAPQPIGPGAHNLAQGDATSLVAVSW